MAAKEDYYDTHISPLMAQIIQHCKEARIPMLAQFELDPPPDQPNNPLFCTTCLYGEGFDSCSDNIPRLIKVAKPRPISMMSLKVLNKDGEVVRHEIIATDGGD